MTLNDALELQTFRPAQLMQKGSLLLVALMATFLLTFRRHHGIGVGVALAICMIVIPTANVLAQRLLAKARQRETEDRLLRNTKVFLSTQEPTVWVAPPPREPDAETLGERVLTALKTDGRALPRQEFRRVPPAVAPVPPAETVVFDALRRRYAVRGLYERRFAHLSATLPKPAMMPLRELLPPVATREFEAWTVEKCKVTIEYANAALDEIRIRAAEGYQRMRHGGVEVGGVLFGTHRNGAVRIEAIRPVECDYSTGPRFVLSRQDEAALAQLLHAAGEDAGLAGMEPVGWYHSHTREALCLSAADVQLFNRFFPMPWQVALVVRPANLIATRAGFFFREADGMLRTESSYREFRLGPASATVA